MMCGSRGLSLCVLWVLFPGPQPCPQQTQWGQAGRGQGRASGASNTWAPPPVQPGGVPKVSVKLLSLNFAETV